MSLANSAAAIAFSIDDMYQAFLAGDQVWFDAHLHDDVTIWETDVPDGLMGRQELDAYRQDRDLAGGRPELVRLEAHDKRIDVWGDIGLARYELVAAGRAVDDQPQRARVTDVFRRVHGRWLIVHHHAEAWHDDTAVPVRAADRSSH